LLTQALDFTGASSIEGGDVAVTYDDEKKSEDWRIISYILATVIYVLTKVWFKDRNDDDSANNDE
jgi:hypothetical protein